MKKIREIFSGSEGFTLIELLIVIVILGVLAAIAVPNLMGLQDSANVETVKTNMRTLLTEIEAELINAEDLSGLESEAFESLKSMNSDNDITITTIGNTTASDGVEDSNVTKGNLLNTDDDDIDYILVAEVENANEETVEITIEDGRLTTTTS